MTRYSKSLLQLTAVAAAAAFTSSAFAAAALDANLELDTTYSNLGRGMGQSGRVEANISGKAGGNDGFVAGKGTLILGKGGAASTDDMWGQIGTSMVDVKWGRFEAADLFPAGKDVLVEGGADVTGGYRANLLRGRFGGAAHFALNVNAGAGVGFELGIVESKTADRRGIRPVVSFAAGPVAVKLGFESGKDNTSTPAGAKFSGFGATVGGTVGGGVGFNVNLASGKSTPVGGTAEKSTSFGVNATFGPAGVGYIMDKNKTLGLKDSVFYAAYSIPVFATGATLTPAVSHQTGTGKAGATSLRVRLNYGF